MNSAYFHQSTYSICQLEQQLQPFLLSKSTQKFYSVKKAMVLNSGRCLDNELPVRSWHLHNYLLYMEETPPIPS